MNEQQQKSLERLAVLTIYSIVASAVTSLLLGVYALANLVL